ncbi:hypothetical protein, partial [Escherichia coli]|uniref:hypothetical protein n=1 Tax=Escherichia coli TaxID=562 RepID=UPI00201AB5BE
MTTHTSGYHSLLISNSSLYRLTFPVLSWFPTTGTYSAFNNLRKPKKNHTEQITPGAIRKRKLTAVCSHQTRIGNLDAHLI